jgi:hypothetical protein
MDTNSPKPDANGVINPGQWKRGQSGNPAGRPKGALNKATEEVRAILVGNGPQVMQQAVDRTMAGSDIALRECMKRLLPVMRSRPVEIDLPADATAMDVAAAMSETVRAMAAGEISPGEAAEIKNVLEGQRRTVETIELERRIARLETLLEDRLCAPKPA